MAWGTCPTIGRTLIAGGMSALIGSAVDVPPGFAADYTRDLLQAWHQEGQRLGDVVHELAKSYLDEYRNPLALSMALFHGLDARFEWLHTEGVGVSGSN